MSVQTPGRRAGNSPAARRTVLVAGGTETFRAALAALLDRQGLGVELAGDASGALSALVMHAPAAVVLSDARPAVDAVDVCRRIRTHAGSRATPVAVVSDGGVDDQTADQLDAALFPADASAGQVAAWVAAAAPPEASPEERLRLTLARTASEDAAATDGATGAAETATADWRRLFDHLEDGAAVLDPGGRVVAANAAFAATLGQPSAAACAGAHLLALLPGVPVAADDVPPGASPRLTVRADGDDAAVPLDLRFTPGGRGPDAPVFVTLRVERWRQAAADAIAANHDLNEQLRRSQKIGALGRLAGGVAHDFNNLLQVIGGYAEALGGDALDPTSRRRLLQRIQRATDRAASLTRQLLAFGRRQVLVPQVLDLNVTVLSLEQLLGRVIGEDVQFVSSLAPDLRRVKVDPGQIEQVLLHLALNARAAMAEGGTLEVATANFLLREAWSHPSLPVPVPPGDWVLLSVLDTGTGMDAETAAQAFEPFFTTKDSSRGSAWACRWCAASSSRAAASPGSERPGAGHSHVLPAVHDSEAPAARDEQPPGSRTSTPPAARCCSSRTTRRSARCSRPSSATAATSCWKPGTARKASVLRAARRRHRRGHHRRVMPSVSGPSLVSALRHRKPAVRVLFVSGYTDQL
ncbi:MAG: histidine kinase dimerization/phospho-acceptor domain-containing protein [Vicinamibacterales bacterium]